MKNLLKTLFLLFAAIATAFAVTACGDEEDNPSHTHTAVKVEAMEASCLETGNNEYWTCSGCDKVFADEACTEETTVEEQMLEKTDHTDEDIDGSCDVCQIALDFIYDSEELTFYVFTAEGLYTWLENTKVVVDGNLKSTNLIIKKDIVLPEEMRFDLDGDGTNDSNWRPAYSEAALIDGGGHSIIGMSMNKNDSNDLAFLNKVSKDSVVQNIFFKDIKIIGGGSLAGITIYNYGTIVNCGVSGTITGSSSNIGGVAANFFGGNIIACYSDVDITAYTSLSSPTGGIVGQYNDLAGSNGRIIACYNTGTISVEGTTVGGIAGNLFTGGIVASYSTGTISGLFASGIVGYADSTITQNYWSTSGDTPVYGEGSDASNEGCAEVDGETVSWASAMSEMNAFLEAEGIEWRYAENTGEDSAIRPLILTKVAE